MRNLAAADLPPFLAELATRTEASFELIYEPWPALPGRPAVVTGSFNPLTRAHAALAQAALRNGGQDAVILAISMETINKPVVEGLSPASE